MSAPVAHQPDILVDAFDGTSHDIYFSAQSSLNALDAITLRLCLNDASGRMFIFRLRL